MVTPSLERAWKIPTKPLGDEWEVPFPFAYMSEEEVGAMILFLTEYMHLHYEAEAELFSVSSLERRDEKETKSITSMMKLAPYEAGVNQTLNINFQKQPEGKWSLTIYMKRLSGETDLWTRTNKLVLDYLRKQLLLWGSIPRQEKDRYLEKYRSREGKET